MNIAGMGCFSKCRLNRYDHCTLNTEKSNDNEDYKPLWVLESIKAELAVSCGFLNVAIREMERGGEIDDGAQLRSVSRRASAV